MSTNPNVDPDKCIGHVYETRYCSYNRRDVILYALGVGATEQKFLYENDDEFCVLPTYPVCWAFKGESSDIVLFGEGAEMPGLTFNPMNILHGTEEIEILQHPLPVEARLSVHGKIANLYDKGKGALVVVETIFKDVNTHKPLVKKTTGIFIRGIGNFGGDRGPKEPKTILPPRAPDKVVEERVPEKQAMLYRLSGDYNPLHADPDMAAMAMLYRLSGDYNPLHADPDMAAMVGFDKPILHGLGSMGYAVRAVLKECLNNNTTAVQSVSVRFSRPVIPGQTLRTEIWQLNSREIVFQTLVNGKAVISNARVRLNANAKANL